MDNSKMRSSAFKTYSRKFLKPLSLTGSQFVVIEQTASYAVLPVQDADEDRSDTNQSPKEQVDLPKRLAGSPSLSCYSSGSQGSSRHEIDLPRKTQRLDDRSSTLSRPLSSSFPTRKWRLPINKSALVSTAQSFHCGDTQPTRSDGSITDDQTRLQKFANAKSRKRTRVVSINNIRISFKRTPSNPKHPVLGTTLLLSNELRHPANEIGCDGFVGTELIVPPRPKVRIRHQPRNPSSVPELELRRGPLPEVVFPKDPEIACPTIQIKAGASERRSSVSKRTFESLQPGPVNSSVTPTSGQLAQTLSSRDDDTSYVQQRSRFARRSTHDILASVMDPTPEPESEAGGTSSDDDGGDDDEDGDEDRTDMERIDVEESEDDESGLGSCSEDEEEEEERILYGVPPGQHQSLVASADLLPPSTLWSSLYWP